MDAERIAKDFLMHGLQHWGQTFAQREKATRDYIEARGFDYPSDDGREWLRGVLHDLRRGEFHDEVRQLKAALEIAVKDAE